MDKKPTGVAASYAMAWDIARQLEYAASTCLYEPAAALMRKAQSEIESRRWIPVGERLPEMGDRVMVSHAADGWVGIGERVLTGAYLHWEDDGEDLYEPTHWMPLPAPPTDAK